MKTSHKITLFLLGISLIGLSYKPVYAEETATLTLQQQYQAVLVQLIDLLKQQIEQLTLQLNQQLADMKKAQETSQTVTEQKIDAVQAKVDTITPVQTFGSVETSVVEKTLRVEALGKRENNSGVYYYDIIAWYSENGKEKENVQITLSADGKFQGNIDGKEGEGSVTLTSRKQSYQGVGVLTTFIPNGKNIVITATANGVTATTTGWSQK